MAYKIHEDRCVGCGACAFICLFDAPSAANADASLYAIDEKKCVECGQCGEACPQQLPVMELLKGFRELEE